MKTLLIVANTPSPNTQRLATAVVRGASHQDLEGISVKFKEPLQATAQDVIEADGVIIGTTENFGYMSGLIKDFFERIYYPCLEIKQGLPYGLYVRAGLDGQGTLTAVSKIVTGLRWKAVQDPLLLHGKFQPEFEQLCEEFGLTVAAGLDSGIF